jgi:para-nitrobenzyl esterase
LSRARPLFAVLLAVAAFSRLAGAPLDTVSTVCGLVAGKREEGIRVFLGIPYASPPTGALRWRPPAEPESWPGVRRALKYGPSCPQKKVPLFDVGRMDEGCLYLNIWTPAVSEDDNLPVMVWIHGGSLAFGSGGQSLYNGNALAKDSVIVVTINYRLGPLGFLAHPALTDESFEQSSGNYGILDQIAALEWVRSNIRRFGGNPDNVTIFGQSAGGLSVAVLMSSHRAAGLFQRAVCQSGAAPYQLRRLRDGTGRLFSAESVGVIFARKLGVAGRTDVLAAMRAKPWSAVLRAWDLTERELSGGVRLEFEVVDDLLIVDGNVLRDAPGRIFAEGRQACVPFLVGTVADEGTLFVPRQPKQAQAQYQEIAARLGSEFRARYAAGNAAHARPAVLRFVDDFFVSAARSVARGSTRTQPNTWLYHFTRETALGRDLGLGAFHGSELGYLFGTYPRRSLNAEDTAMSRILRDHWTNFARNGNPNATGSGAWGLRHGDLPEWPRYDSLDRHLILAVPPRTGQYLRQDACDFLDRARDW